MLALDPQHIHAHDHTFHTLSHDNDPKRKAQKLFTLSEVVHGKIGDARWAADLLGETLALDPSRLDAFERLFALYTELQDWGSLIHCYRERLDRTSIEDAELRYALIHQLGLVYRDRLGDAPRAIECFRKALELKPDSDADRKLLCELLVIVGDLDEAVDFTRRVFDRNPLAVEPMKELYTLFLRKRQFDHAWCAVDVLGDTLSVKLTTEQERFLIGYSPMPLELVPGRLMPEAWDSHILHPDLDPTITAILRIVVPVIIRAKLGTSRRRAREEQLGGRLAEEQTDSTYPILRTFLDASEILGLSPPDLRVHTGLTAPFAVAIAEKPTVHVSIDHVRELSAGSRAFFAGKYIALLQPELMARAMFPSVPLLKSLIGAAVRAATSNSGIWLSGDELDGAIRSAILPEELEALRQVVKAALAMGSLLDVARWAKLAELSASRAGLLLAGSLDVARRANVYEPHYLGDPTSVEWLTEMISFAISDTYAELRAAIGVGVPANS
ncbi:tetratricopeptide repeat protein [Pendulispora albinea]|uniref:Tetratricopeptide repeat protein n=1 Tax=Pendulispora albinea TaxID=2741071 RepID=A0ABZ2LQE4_9BACT